jgi:hypothetical protein
MIWRRRVGPDSVEQQDSYSLFMSWHADTLLPWKRDPVAEFNQPLQPRPIPRHRQSGIGTTNTASEKTILPLLVILP